MIDTRGSKFEFTNNTNFWLFAGECICGRTYAYIQTDIWTDL